MMKPNNNAKCSEFDAYVDGTLAAAERDQFSRELITDGQLRADIELQSRIDVSLAELFAAPKVPAELLEQLREAAAATPVVTGERRRWMKLAGLAAAAIVVWAVLGWHLLGNRTEKRQYSPNLPFATIYEKYVADGFRPKWVCEDKHEFASTFWERQGQALLLADMPAGTKMEGLTYCGGLSRYTTTMLSRVDGSPVMVFVDRAAADTHPALPDGETKLRLFRKELGPLVLYELTPLDQPKVSDYLYLAAVPPR